MNKRTLSIDRLCALQEAQRQMQILLDMGADVSGTPAEAQLTNLIPLFIRVFRCDCCSNCDL